MEQLRDVFANSRVYCGGFRAQHVSLAARGAADRPGQGRPGQARAGRGTETCCAASAQQPPRRLRGIGRCLPSHCRQLPRKPRHPPARPQVISLMHGQRRLAGAVEVVPGIYLGSHEAAVAEVATGGLQQVRA